jgi:drug/metabolite transporter (DMT)-like permease
MKIGPMAYTVVIVSCSTVFTALSGFFFFGERIGVLQLVGIVLMVGSFLFATEKKEGEKKGSLRWLIFCLLSFAFCGGIGFMQKIHQTSAYKDELNGFLVMAFAVSFIYSVASLGIMKLKKKTCEQAQENTEGKKNLFSLMSIGAMILCGICTAMNHKLNLFLSGAMDTAVFFPVFNGSVLVLTIVIAVIGFREKLSVKKWIGVAFGCIAVMLLVL